MKNKFELLKELKEKFEKTKSELEFQSSFEEIDRIFFISDGVLQEGFVSDNYSRQLCSRISNTYMSWANYLHGLLMPNPHYMISATESKAVNDSESKNKIWEMIRGALAIASKNSLVGINKDKKMEAELIDEAVTYWNSTFKNEVSEILEKINKNWKS